MLPYQHDQDSKNHHLIGYPNHFSVVDMRGLQKSMRVSWASDLTLCQEKLFLTDESPSQIGLSGEDGLQAKTLWHQQSIGTERDESLPPGFDRPHPTNLLKNKLSQIHLTKWWCPPKFMMPRNWQVASGEESEDAEVQNQREMRVLEAIYPRGSDIPLNPSVLMDINDLPINNNQNTPVIPITPIEEEEAKKVENTPLNPIDLTNPVEIAAAAYRALISVMPTGDQANLIDPDLLVKILTNPKLIENLLADHNKHITPVDHHLTRNEAASPPSLVDLIHPNHPRSYREPLPNVRPESLPDPPPVMKDVNYYKELVQQHGGERRDDNVVRKHGRERRDDNVGRKYGGERRDDDDVDRRFSSRRESSSSNEYKRKIPRSCLYFNTAKGCRNGDHCPYQHNPPSKRRMRSDREITG